jgi:hypothetical protein
VFIYDAIDVYGDTAVVRIHHHVGAAVIENGKKVPDYNREAFVLRKIDGFQVSDLRPTRAAEMAQ